LYNLIKRALVTVDEAEKIKLFKDKEKEVLKEENKTEEEKIGENNEKAVSQEVTLAREKARFIIEEAQSQAKKVIEEVENMKKLQAAELDKLSKELIDRNQQEAASLQQQFELKKEELENSFNSLIGKIRSEKNEYIELSSRQLAFIIRLIVQKIVFLSLSDREIESLENKISTLIKKTMDYKNVVFYMNPEDMQLIPENVINEIKKVIPDAEFRHSPILKRGDIKVDSDYGTYDGSIEGQLDMLESLVSDVFQTGEI